VVLDNQRRGLAWRVATVAMVAIVIILWRSCVARPAYVVQIEFGLAPEVLAGAEVVIDGEVVGLLARQGNRTLSGFPVAEGDHTVELRLPGCESEQARFTSGFGGARVVFMWYPDVRMQGADSICVLRVER
jgi:hypothetical protein